MKALGLLIMSLALSACSSQDDARRLDVDVPQDRLDSREAQQRGRVLFLDNCAICHGVRADGEGVRREGLSARPANFRNKDWRARTDALQVYTVLSEGKRGSSMPAWPTLSDEERWDLVAYVLSVSEETP
jgi:mono/diheme cytochrome c family protein